MAVRTKHRYILVETSSDTGMSGRKQLENLFYAQVMAVTGSMRYHNINPRIVRHRGPTSFIIRVRHRGLSEMIAALALMRSFNGKETAFYTLKSSGTLLAVGRSS
jgi:RNase P/RNase MRP subunit POP5